MSELDKALAWNTGGWGLNPDMSKAYSAPIFSGTPAMCSLSLTMPVVNNSNVKRVTGEVKKRGIMVKP